MKNRICIFGIENINNILNAYVIRYIIEISKYVDYFIFISSEEYGVEVELDFDFDYHILFTDEDAEKELCIKSALDFVGFDKLSEIENLFITDESFYGPFYSFKQTIENMSQKKLDFWKIGETKDFYDFLWINNCILQKDDFKEFWQNRFEDTYSDDEDESVSFEEYLLTGDFEYDYAVKGDEKAEYFFLSNPLSVLKDYNCPVLKKSVFAPEYVHMMQYSNGDMVIDLVDYIKSGTEYDVDIILDDITANGNLFDIYNSFQLGYILQEKSIKEIDKNVKLAAKILIRDAKNIKYIFDQIKDVTCFYSMDFYAVYQDVYDALTAELNGKLAARVHLIEEGNSFYDAFFKMSEEKNDADYYCYMSDLDIDHKEKIYSYISAENRTFNNLIGSDSVISNIIDIFAENKNIGLIASEPPIHGPYFKNIKQHWNNSAMIVSAFLNDIDTEININADRPPVGVFNNCFWIRKDCLDDILSVQGSIEESLEHIIHWLNEYNAADMMFANSFAYLCQAQKYLTSYVNTAFNAGNDLIMYRELNSDMLTNSRAGKIFESAVKSLRGIIKSKS